MMINSENASTVLIPNTNNYIGRKSSTKIVDGYIEIITNRKNSWLLSCVALTFMVAPSLLFFKINSQGCIGYHDSLQNSAESCFQKLLVHTIHVLSGKSSNFENKELCYICDYCLSFSVLSYFPLL